MPRDMHCTGVRLVCQNDDGERASISMQWERMEGQGEEWWSVEYTPAQIGVYWYNFEYDAQWGRGQINNVGNSIGSITSEGGPWQLTVYRAESRTPEKIKGGIIYQIFPDRFYNSGTRKKNVPDDRLIREDWGAEPMWEPDDQGKIHKYDYFGGDLKGIEMKLDYLKELGVSCIYLNPIFEAHSNHRYDTADYMRIDPLLGTNEEFKELCSRARDFGINIVLDGVFSHTGADSVYFNKAGRYETVGAWQSESSQYRSWYKFFDGSKYESWWGFETLPEVNENNVNFRDFICGPNGV
ncbi:MAG: alpha-amylase family glycosyl hydrolase, partial [Oscillospiraceae bacterium]